MTFFIFMAILALALIFALWLVFQLGKPRPRKKIKQATKKIPPTEPSPAKPDPNRRRKVFKKQVATELLKRNPDIVAAVIKQWLREK